MRSPIETILAIMSGNLQSVIDELRVPVCQMVECAVQVLGVDPNYIKCTADLLPPGIGGLLDTVTHSPTSVLVVNVVPMEIPLHNVVAHEMIHYKQHMDGRLAHASDVATRKPVMIWEGKRYDNYRQDDVYSMPWEVEAYELMAGVGEAMVAVMERRVAETLAKANVA